MNTLKTEIKKTLNDSDKLVIIVQILSLDLQKKMHM